MCCTGATPNPQTWSAQLCRLVPWAQTCLLPCLLGKHQLRRVGLGEWGGSPGLRPWPTVTPRRAGHLSHGSPPLCKAQGHSLEINPAVPEYVSAHRPCLIDFIDFLLLLCPSQATSRVALPTQLANEPTRQTRASMREPLTWPLPPWTCLDAQDKDLKGCLAGETGWALAAAASRAVMANL